MLLYDIITVYRTLSRRQLVFADHSIISEQPKHLITSYGFVYFIFDLFVVFFFYNYKYKVSIGIMIVSYGL